MCWCSARYENVLPYFKNSSQHADESKKQMTLDEYRNQREATMKAKVTRKVQDRNVWKHPKPISIQGQIIMTNSKITMKTLNVKKIWQKKTIKRQEKTFLHSLAFQTNEIWNSIRYKIYSRFTWNWSMTLQKQSFTSCIEQFKKFCHCFQAEIQYRLNKIYFLLAQFIVSYWQRPFSFFIVSLGKNKYEFFIWKKKYRMTWLKYVKGL